MDDSNNNQLQIKISNYSGPLDALLDLAKSQKVNLADISVTLLVDQFIDFIKSAKKLNLDLASEYLLMASWLVYLKSKLLLPDDSDDEFQAKEVAEKLKLQLKRLELIRLLSDQLMKKNRIGKDIFFRGKTGGIRSIHTPEYKVSLYEIFKAYANNKMKKDFMKINIVKLPTFTTEEGIKVIQNHMNSLIDWKKISELIPANFLNKKDLKRSGLAGIFSASLEMVKEGNIKITQKSLFDDLYIRKDN
ncbi:MAG: segregation/condensation protein A [Candidatus Pelagibacter sp. TMED64]|nr:segregation/condensation protein A [Candidatus Pelagibacter sp.]OUU66076.1 MAG: segregation/condensation protein A [Candidatus Pelagibacter sp. TMED64]|tara:strand:+ start:660 stop:1400 length:741 start_codon:yes stop_codon:yes gene_type:complete